MLAILYVVFLEMYTEYHKLRTMPEKQYVVTKVWILLARFSSSEIL